MPLPSRLGSRTTTSVHKIADRYLRLMASAEMINAGVKVRPIASVITPLRYHCGG